jgi:hypothetical protein
MTPSGIEPATFRLVAQCLIQQRHRVESHWCKWIIEKLPESGEICFPCPQSIRPSLLHNNWYNSSLRMVYYSYFHSIMTYGLIFWGNFHYSGIIFRLQKRIIRIILGIRGRDSCREHFKKLKILPLQSQYRLSILLFVINNKGYLMVNSEIHNVNTKTKSNLHRPIPNLSTYQKGRYYSGIKVLNSLPSQIKDLFHNRHQFKRALKNFLYFHSFYTLDEYFSWSKN